MTGSRISRKTGTAFFVQDNYWYSLPLAVREATYWGFHQVFFFNHSKYMKLVGVNKTEVPKQIDLVDAVVQVYELPQTAGEALAKTVSSQLNQIQDYHIPLPSYLSDTFGLGRSFTLKEVLKGPHGGAVIPICVTESAVSLLSALGWWQWKTREIRRQPGRPITGRLGEHVLSQRETSTRWLSEAASVEWQKWFGTCLGRMLAHEVWHQIWSSDSTINTEQLSWRTHPGKSYFLEEEGGGSFWHQKDCSGFGSYGREWISNALPKLDKLQGDHQTYAINRR